MNRKPFSSNMSGSSVIEVIEELTNSPQMPEWYVYQPPLAFKPMGIVVWGGEMIHSFRIGLEEQLMGDVPCGMFTSPHTLDELKLRAQAGILIRSFNTTQLVFPSMSPATRINMHVSGNPKTVAVYGIQLTE
jgi:hypothetical protein